MVFFYCIVEDAHETQTHVDGAVFLGETPADSFNFLVHTFCFPFCVPSGVNFLCVTMNDMSN